MLLVLHTVFSGGNLLLNFGYTMRATSDSCTSRKHKLLYIDCGRLYVPNIKIYEHFKNI